MKLSSSPAPVLSSNAQQSRNTTNAIGEDRYGMPVRLIIPKMNVDAAVKQMGLTASGDMEAPQTDEDSGWYKYGPRPGNVGSAVIAGHLGIDGRAVFGQLSQLVKGDNVSVIDESGQTVMFVVMETRTYSKEAAPGEVFTSTSGAHLNLITCEGSWDAGQSTYAQRLVVFTDRVE